MYKKNNKPYYPKWGYIIRLCVLMKLAFLLILLSTFNVLANVSAQSLSLHVNGGNLRAVMLEVKKKTGYDFLYNSKALKNSKPVYVQLSNVSLETALDEIVKGQNLAYKIKGSNVIISEKKELELFWGSSSARDLGNCKGSKRCPNCGG